MADTEPLIKVEHVKKYFPIYKSTFHPERNRYVHALDDVSLHISKGEIVGLVGESGSGKSTLGRCILNLEHIDSGAIKFHDRALYVVKGNAIHELAKKNQMIFQNPYSSFNPKMTFYQVFREVGKVYGQSKEENENRIQELMKLINMTPDYLDRTPQELSGGQLQRLAIVRALMLHPDFVIADEAVSALDVSVQAQILNLFMDMREQLGLAILFISHDLNVVEMICDRVAILYLGQIMEMASAEEIYKNTLHPYSVALLASKPRSNPDEPIHREALQGEIPDAVNVSPGCRFYSRCPRAKRGLCDRKMPELKDVGNGHLVACHMV